MANYDSNYAIAQEISNRIGTSPVPFDSVYSIALEIYHELGGEESQFDSVYSILLGILPLTDGIAHIDDSTISSGSTWSSAKIASELADAGFAVEVVEELPTTGDTHTIYFAPSSGSASGNTYDEFMYIDGAWEQVGSTAVDLSDYAKKLDYFIPINIQTQETDWTVLNTATDGVYRVALGVEMAGQRMITQQGVMTNVLTGNKRTQTIVVTPLSPSAQGSPLQVHYRTTNTAGSQWYDYDYNLGVINDGVLVNPSHATDKVYSRAKVDDLLNNKQDTLIAGEGIEISGNTISATGGEQPDLMVNVTYSQLKSLRDNNQLVKGQKYRITDYVTTVDKENMKSGNHQFDVIVTADDVNKLNENAKAINHDFSGQTVTYHKWMYDNTGDAWILSNEDSYTNEVSGTCPLENTPMYGMDYYTNVYPIEGVIGVDDEVPYTPQVYRKAIIYNDGNTLYLGDYIDEDKWNYWVEEGDVEGDYPEWFIGKYFLDGADTYSYDGTYVEGEDYFNPSVEPLHIWLTHNESSDAQYKIYTEERSYSNSAAGVCEITGEWEGLDYYTVGYPIAGVEYVDGESGAYLNDEKRILYTDNDSLVFGDSPYNFLLEKYNEETEAGEPHEYTLEQIEWFNGKLFEDVGDTEQFATTYEGVIEGVNAKLNAWELKYCLDNDKSRFDWAQEGQEGFAAIQAERDGDYLIWKRYPSEDIPNPSSPAVYPYAWVRVDESNVSINEVTDWDNIDTGDIAYTPTLDIVVGGAIEIGGEDSEITEYEPNVGAISAGKGVIYYMKDEYNNQCDYDFKNILKTSQQIIAFYYSYGTMYAIRVPEKDGTNPSTDEYDDYQYAWKLFKFTGGEGATVTFPDDFYCNSGTWDYQPLDSLPSYETQNGFVYFPISNATQFDDFLWRGDDCDYTVCVLDVYTPTNCYTFDINKKDDTLFGNSYNNIIISQIDNGVIVLPDDLFIGGVQNKQNLLNAGSNVKIDGNKLDVILPKATTSQLGVVQVGDGLNVGWNDGVISLRRASSTQLGGVTVGNGLTQGTYGQGALSLVTASNTQLGGIKVGSGLSISDGVLSNNYSLPTASSSTKGGIKVGSGLDINNEILSIPYYIFNNISKTTRNLTPLNEQYFTVEALENCNVYWTSDNYNDISVTIEYSKDKINWTSVTISGETVLLSALTPLERLYIRGNNSKYSYYSDGYVSRSKLSVDGKFNVFGNIMSLINSNNFSNLTTLTENYCFADFFYETSVYDASDLLLPATSITEYCYHEMFTNCTSLIVPPALPATTLAVGCYVDMFRGCTNLLTAPTLPATMLPETCYLRMFYDCNKINNIVMLAESIDSSATMSLYKWVKSVASSGTFTKSAVMTTLPTGENGIPSGWTVVDYVTPNP